MSNICLNIDYVDSFCHRGRLKFNILCIANKTAVNINISIETCPHTHCESRFKHLHTNKQINLIEMKLLAHVRVRRRTSSSNKEKKKNNEIASYGRGSITVKY